MVSRLDWEFDYTEFPDIQARTKDDWRTTLRELAHRIERASGDTKEQLRWLKLATFGKKRSGGGSLRNNANLLAITGIELDYDAGDLPWDRAWARLYEAGLTALLYTSPRYTHEWPRFRVLIPTSASLPVATRAALVERACRVLRGTIDPASSTLSQAFYYGTARRVRDKPDGAWRDGFPVRVQLIDPPDGRFIDLASDLDGPAPGEDDDGPPPIEGSLADPLDTDTRDTTRIKAMLAYIPSEAYLDWRRVGMALHDTFDGGEDGYALWDEWSQTTGDGNYDSAGQRKTWNSFDADRSEAHIGFGTIVHMAKDHGWRPQSAIITPSSLRLLSTWECEAAKPSPYVWKGALAQGQVGCIFGAPGAGKSLIAPYIAFRIASGDPAFGLRTRPGSILYIAAEDATGMQKRIAALARRHGHSSSFILVDGVSDLFAEDGGDMPALKEVIEAHRPTVIVIDTLAAAFPGLEENDAKAMGRVVAVARELAESGAAVLLIHHDTKAEGGTPRGHSILNGALDMTMHVKRDGQIVRGTFRKNRNGTTDRDIAFRIGVERLGEDEDGDAVTAAIVEELDGAGAPRQPRLPKSQRAALAILAALSNEGTPADDQWMAACVESADVSPAPERKSRQAAYRRARNALLQAGIVQISEAGEVSRTETVSAQDWL